MGGTGGRDDGTACFKRVTDLSPGCKGEEEIN